MINEINVDFPVLPVSKYAEQLNQEAAARKSRDRGGIHHSSEPHKRPRRQLRCPVLNLRSNQKINRSHEGNEASLTCWLSHLPTGDKDSGSAIIKNSLRAGRYKTAECLIHMHKTLGSNSQRHK